MVSLVVSYKANVSKKIRYCVWMFLFLYLFVVFAWCYYSLFDVATLIVILCSMLLLLLLPLAWCSLLDTIAPIVVPCSTLLFLFLFLTWHCCYCCYSLFDGVAPCLTLLLLFLPLLLFLVQCYYSTCHSLFNIIVPLLPLVRHYHSFCYSLVNVTTPLVAPCSMLLFLYSFILDTVCSSTSMLCCDVDVFLLLTWCYCSYSS